MDIAIKKKRERKSFTEGSKLKLYKTAVNTETNLSTRDRPNCLGKCSRIFFGLNGPHNKEKINLNFPWKHNKKTKVI